MARERQAEAGRFIDPTVPILVVTLVVHVVRRDVVDIAVFAGAIAIIGLDHRRPMPVVRIPRIVVRRWWVLAGSLGIGALGALPVGSVPVRLALIAVGLLAAGAVLTAPRPAPPLAGPPAGTGPGSAGGRWWAWPAVLVLLALIELASFVLQPDPQTGSYANPTLSTLLDPVFREPWARILALTLWSASGWWLLRAVRSPERRP